MPINPYSLADNSELFGHHASGQTAEQHLAALPDQQGIDANALYHQATVLDLAHRGRAAGDEILRRQKAGELYDPQHIQQAEEIQKQRQEEQDKHIATGLANGELVIGSTEDQRRLMDNANARAKFRNSPYLDEDQRQELIGKTFANDAEIRRAAMPIPPEQQANMPGRKIQEQLAGLDPEMRQAIQPFVVMGEKGVPQVMRGMPQEALLPVSMRRDEGGAANNQQLAQPAAAPQPGGNQIPIVDEQQYNALPGGTWHIQKNHPELGPRQKPYSLAETAKRSTVYINPDTGDYSDTKKEGYYAYHVDSKTGEKKPVPSPKLEEDPIHRQHLLDVQIRINTTRADWVNKQEAAWKKTEGNEGKEPDEKQIAAWEERAKRVHPDPPELVEYQQKRQQQNQQQKPERSTTVGGHGRGPQQPAEDPNQKPQGINQDPDVVSAIQAAKMGDVKAQKALEKKGIQWQQ